MAGQCVPLTFVSDDQPPDLTGNMQTLFKKFGVNEQILLSSLAIAVGLLVGYGSILFRHLIEFFQLLFMGSGSENVGEIVSGLAWWHVCLMPILGGLVVGPLVHFLFPGSRGHGVPEVMVSVALQGGKLKLRDGLGKMLASAISIGAGASVGREGPVIHLGATLASWLGQKLGLTTSHLRTMVGCGAAAGIAASFNAPIAGVMFALEVIIADYGMATFSPIVLSSVIATVIARLHLGDFPAFIVPHYTMMSAWEIPSYVLLGVLCGVTGIVFMSSVFKSEDLMARLPLPRYLRPVVGGAVLGLMGLAYPQVMGVGYDTMNLALLEELGGGLMLALVGMKILATAITLGSGFSGGVFTPSLYLGAMVGGAFGVFAHQLMPAISAGPGAYTLVGMGAMAACVLGAPMASILILFELTGDYRIMLALMVCSIVASLIIHQFYKDSIYTRALRRKNIDLWSGKESGPLSKTQVAAVMRTDCAILPETMTIRRFKNRITQSHEESFVVVDDQGRLKGLLHAHDVRGVIFEKGDDVMLVQELLGTRELVTVSPADTLLEAFLRMGANNLDQIPVVSPDNPRQVLGVITNSDVIRVHAQATQSNDSILNV